jgi:hypothetical protein
MAELINDYSLNDDGTVTFAFEHVTRMLRRPNLRQYRDAVESLSRLRQSYMNPESGTVDMDKQLDGIVSWFDSVFQSLAGEGFPRNEDGSIDDTQLPPWLLNAEIITDLIGHWQTSPNRRGAP